LQNIREDKEHPGRRGKAVYAQALPNGLDPRKWQREIQGAALTALADEFCERFPDARTFLPDSRDKPMWGLKPYLVNLSSKILSRSDLAQIFGSFWGAYGRYKNAWWRKGYLKNASW